MAERDLTDPKQREAELARIRREAVLTPWEYALLRRYSPRTVRRWLQRGLVPNATKSPGRNGQWRIPNLWRVAS